MRQLFEESRRNQNETILGSAAVRPLLEDVKNIVGEQNLPGVLREPDKAFRAMAELRSSLLDYKEKNPKATESDLNRFAAEESVRIIKNYRPDAVVTPEDEKRSKEAATAKAGPTTTAPNTAVAPPTTPPPPTTTAPNTAVAKPAEAPAAAPKADDVTKKQEEKSQAGIDAAWAPRKGQDYQKMPLFPSKATFDSEVALLREGKMNKLSEWAKVLGVTVSDIVRAQQRILK